MLGRASLLACLVLVGCGGSSFDVAGESADDAGGEDTSTSADTGSVATDSGGGDGSVPPDSGTTSETGTPDSGTESGPPTCPPVGPGTTDLYVDAKVSTSGTGIFTCPLKTILEALAVSKNAGVTRTIHVAAGSYAETDVLHITADIAIISEGGRSKLTGGSKSNCSGVADKCVVDIEGSGTLEGFDVDASGVAFGVVAGGALRPSVVKSCSLAKANRVGLVVTGNVEAGPNLRVDDNGESNAWVRAGNLHVLPGTNSFDRSAGKGGSGVPAGGIVVFNGATLNFEGGTAKENQHGVIFDWGSASTAKQSITGLTATGNRVWGVSVPHGQKQFQLRKSTLVGNNVGGIFLEYEATPTNVFDLGSALEAGNNVFGGAGAKNAKVGVFLCRPPLAVSGGGDSFSVCPPLQVAVSNCDSMPASYADVAYTGITGMTGGPLTTPSCTVGP